MDKKEIKTFTVEYDGVKNALKNQCGISEALDLTGFVEFNALWDTGATGSAISKRVIQKLRLEPTGKARLFHAGGDGGYVDTYSINILLPNNTFFLVEKATESELTGMDVLIGMDIISSGDFAVTASQGKTKFSFQYPSTHNIDFVKENNQKEETKMERFRIWLKSLF
jgi:predicted aspartyl protease